MEVVPDGWGSERRWGRGRALLRNRSAVVSALCCVVHSHSLSPSLSKTRGSRPATSVHLVGVVRLAEKMDHRLPRAGVSFLGDASEPSCGLCWLCWRAVCGGSLLLSPASLVRTGPEALAVAHRCADALLAVPCAGTDKCSRHSCLCWHSRCSCSAPSEVGLGTPQVTRARPGLGAGWLRWGWAVHGDCGQGRLPGDSEGREEGEDSPVKRGWMGKGAPDREPVQRRPGECNDFRTVVTEAPARCAWFPHGEGCTAAEPPTVEAATSHPQPQHLHRQCP